MDGDCMNLVIQGVIFMNVEGNHVYYVAMTLLMPEFIDRV